MTDDPLWFESRLVYWYWLFHSFEYTNYPINYHPMNLLPSIASSNFADTFTKPLSAPTHHRYFSAIGDIPTDPVPSADPTATVTAPTVVASAPTVS